MSPCRIRLLALALICAALTLAVRRTLADSPSARSADPSVRPMGIGYGIDPERVIPVEIVEVGRAPRIHQVRLAQ